MSDLFERLWRPMPIRNPAPPKKLRKPRRRSVKREVEETIRYEWDKKS